MHDHSVPRERLFKLTPIAVGRIQDHGITRAGARHCNELSVVGIKSGQPIIIGKLLEPSAVIRNIREFDKFALGRVVRVVEQVTQEGITNARLPRRSEMSPVLFKDQPELIEHHNPMLHQFPQPPNTLELALGSSVRIAPIRNDSHIGVDDARSHSAAERRRCSPAS
jgi:hypothetical protein